VSKVDQFESVFRAASKTPFEYRGVEVGSVLVVSDTPEDEAGQFGDSMRSFLSVLERGENVRWRVVHGGEYGSVPELLELVEQERPGHTLQATALVNEAYLKLIDQSRIDWKGRAHFFAVAAETIEAPMTTPSSGVLPTHTGGMVSASRPL